MKDSSVKFTMTPESLRNISQAQVPIPQFVIDGFLHATICDISSPFTGEVRIESVIFLMNVWFVLK